MQVKLNVVKDPSAKEDPDSDPRLGAAAVAENGIVGPMQMSEPGKEMEVSVPEKGSVRLTVELPPITYDEEQKAATRGKWPKKEEAKPAPTGGAAPSKSPDHPGAQGGVGPHDPPRPVETHSGAHAVPPKK